MHGMKRFILILFATASLVLIYPANGLTQLERQRAEADRPDRLL